MQWAKYADQDDGCEGGGDGGDDSHAVSDEEDWCPTPASACARAARGLPEVSVLDSSAFNKIIRKSMQEEDSKYSTVNKSF